jgi:amino acid permease
MAVNSVSDYSEDENANNTLYEEIKKQFERYEELRKGLDNKANTMITISTAISTLFIAIGTFLISKIDPKNEIYFG